MSKQVLEAGPAPDVVISEVQGDLQVRGWETNQVTVQAESQEVVIDRQDDQVQISCHGDLDLHLPVGSNLSLGSLHGDASIKFLQSALEISQVHGTLDLRQLAGCRITQVRGDLRVRSLTDDLLVAHIDGDADARHIRGDCSFELVNGDLDLQEITGSIKAVAAGDARLRLIELTGKVYSIKAGGNLYCYLPEDSGLRVRMTSGGHVIKVRLPQGSTTYRQPEYELTLGDAAEAEDRLMSLSAGGTVYLFVESQGWSVPASGAAGSGLPEDFGQQIARQLEETERIVEQARRTGERESSRAQEKMRRTQEKLERKMEAHRRASEARGQTMADRRTRRASWSAEWPTPPTPPPPPAPPVKLAVSEEERLLILRMLEQKKISLEEADRLLSVLEGDE